MLSVAMLHLEFGPPSRTNRESKGERVIKSQNLLSSGYFRSTGPIDQPICPFAWKMCGITSYWFYEQDCISIFYLSDGIWASGLMIYRWWKILSSIFAIFAIFPLVFHHFHANEYRAMLIMTFPDLTRHNMRHIRSHQEQNEYFRNEEYGRDCSG